MKYARAVWRAIGVVVYYGSWPVLRWYLSRSVRTRVVVSDGGTVLLVRPWMHNGLWTLPGGGVKKGEDPRDAAARELREETGVPLGRQALQHYGKRLYRFRGISFWYHRYGAYADNSMSKRVLTLEILDTAWVPFGDISDWPLDPAARQDILDWKNLQKYDTM